MSPAIVLERFAPQLSDRTQDRLLSVLRNAARTTRFYRDLAASAGVDPQADLTALAARLPKVELLDYLKYTERYESPPSGLEAVRDALPHRRYFFPLTAMPRTALVSEGYWPRLNVRRFANPWQPAMSRWAPEALAGPLDTVRAFAEGVAQGYTWIPPLRHSITVQTGILEGPLSEADRDFFWRVFGVPVYEQFMGFGGELIAHECEAHHGLHLVEENALAERDETGEILLTWFSNPRHPVLRLGSGITAELAAGTCACGRTSPRLLYPKRRLVSKPYRALHAEALAGVQ